MTLSTADIDRVAAALRYPVTSFYLGAVISAADQAIRIGGTPTEDRITTYLDEIDTLKAAISAAAAGSGLIQADVLKWSDRPGGRSAGFQQELNRVTLDLSVLLQLQHYGVSGSSGSGNTLCRS